MEIGKILENGKVEKEFFNQGYIYKNYDNFKNKKGICYISEYQTDNITNKSEGKDYETYESLKKLVDTTYEDYELTDEDYSKELVLETLFDMLDWQYASTLIVELMDTISWVVE